MSSPLCSAVARCHARRLLGLASANPLAALAAAAVAVVAPFACLRLGHALGDEFRGSLAAGVADGILAGPALAAAVAGVALAVSFPGRSALGAQVAAAPFPGRAAVVAVCLVPALGALVLVLPALVALCTALVAALDGEGGPTGVALAAAVLAAVPGGAMLAEGVLAAVRGAWPPVGLVFAGTVAWALLGWALGGPAAGPLAPVADALRDDGSAWSACGASSVTLLALAAGWVSLAARRPERRSRSRRSSTRLVHRRAGVPAALAAVLVRRADVRLAAGGAVAFGLGGVVLATVATAPAPAAFMLGTTTTLLGSVVAPLAVFGVVREGRWVWLSTPWRRAAIARLAWAVVLVLTSAPVVAVGTAALLAASASWSAVGTVAVVALLAVDAAVVAGVLLPWGAGAGDQLSTFAAFGAIAIATSLAVGLIAPRLVSVGLPDPLIALALCSAGASGAIVALRRGLEGARS